jgi:hypothetical protein
MSTGRFKAALLLQRAFALFCARAHSSSVVRVAPSNCVGPHPCGLPVKQTDMAWQVPVSRAIHKVEMRILYKVRVQKGSKIKSASQASRGTVSN